MALVTLYRYLITVYAHSVRRAVAVIGSSCMALVTFYRYLTAVYAHSVRRAVAVIGCGCMALVTLYRHLIAVCAHSVRRAIAVVSHGSMRQKIAVFKGFSSLFSALAGIIVYCFGLAACYGFYVFGGRYLFVEITGMLRAGIKARCSRCCSIRLGCR